jgi:hypothetical protein
LAQGDDIVPIPGTKRRKYLEENIGALAIHLTSEEPAEIDVMLPAGAAAGSLRSTVVRLIVRWGFSQPNAGSSGAIAWYENDPRFFESGLNLFESS